MQAFRNVFIVLIVNQYGFPLHISGWALQLEFSNGTNVCQKGSSFRRCGEDAAARYSSKRLSTCRKKKDFFVGSQNGSLQPVLSVIARHSAGPFITRRNVDILRAKRKVRCGLEESHMMDSMKAKFTSQKIHINSFHTELLVKKIFSSLHVFQ